MRTAASNSYTFTFIQKQKEELDYLKKVLLQWLYKITESWKTLQEFALLGLPAASDQAVQLLLPLAALFVLLRQWQVRAKPLPKHTSGTALHWWLPPASCIHSPGPGEMWGGLNCSPPLCYCGSSILLKSQLQECCYRVRISSPKASC